MKNIFLKTFTLSLLMVFQVAFAQDTVTGTVSDNNGQPIPGATIVLKGTSTATTADFDGNFSINVGLGDVLVVSYVGYSSSEVVVNSSTLSIVLDSATKLDEVVVTGYGEISKKKSAVASSKLSASTIEFRPNASVINTLAGQVAGLDIWNNSGEPGSNSVINLRGRNSINGNTEPLILLDGTPIDEDDFQAFNPNEIESIDILKDAGATSIYGNRGANGVILITTKRGQFEKPLEINVSSFYTYAEVADNEYNMMSASEILALENSRGVGYGNTLTQEEIDEYPDYFWGDFFYRNAKTTNHNISLSSGGKKSSQFTSLGYFEQEGAVIKSRLKRFNLRNNLNVRSTDDKFRLASSLSINYSKTDELASLGTGSINWNLMFGPMMAVPYITPGDYVTWEQRPSDIFISDKYPDLFSQTPLLLMDQSKNYVNQDEDTKIIYNIDVQYDILDNLTFRSSTGLDYFNATNLNWQDPNAWTRRYFARNNPEELGLAGRQSQSDTRIFTVNQLTSLNWDTVIDSDHTINIGLYSEYFKAHYTTFGYNAQGLNPKTTFPGDGSAFIGDNSANDFFTDTGSAGLNYAGLFSYFGSADYDFKGKYGFSATYRRDASYRFSTTNRWATFGSVAARWNVSDEDFMENTPFDYLKLRTSYGTSGNQRIVGGGYFSGADLYESLFGTGTGYQGQVSTFLAQIPNNALKWEEIEQVNVGIEFSIFDNLLNGEIDVYQKTTNDLYQSRPISAVNATTSIAANIGGLKNNGIDVDLNLNVLKASTKDDLSLSLGLKGNYNKNELFDLPGDQGYIDGIGRNGGKVGEFKTIRFYGINPATGNLLFLTADNLLTESPNADTDRVWLDKSDTPDYFGSVTLSTSFKGFTLQAQANYTSGIFRYNNNYANSVDYDDIGSFNMSNDVLRAWTPTNRVTDMPSLDSTNRTSYSSSRFLRDGDYFNLRFVSLSYTLGENIIGGTGIKNCNIYVNAENLITFTEWKGIDAVSRSSGSREFPNPKLVSVGIDLTF